MRRVSVNNAQAGMVLAKTVYDVKGVPVLEMGEKLTDAKLPLLARTTSAEIVIEDERSADIVVGSLFPVDAETKAGHALNILLVMNQGHTQGVQSGGLVGLVAPINRLVDCVYPFVVGDPAITGSHTLQGYHYVHPIKAAELSMVIAQLAGADKPELSNIGLAAALMNIGYLGLRPMLLEKTLPLEKEDWEQIRKHPEFSVSMLTQSGLKADAMLAIQQHHERWDGSGYPLGLKGHDISLYARILAIADSYIALLSRRPYRPAMRPHEAIEYIIAYSGEMFDPELARMFTRQIPQYPAGITVALSTGEAGIVTDPNVGHVARPKVRVLAVHGVPVKNPHEVDLSHPDNQRKLIVEVDI
jgi:HD-GYP domain-containing protein (c-di-GMP phosphodiesterase class II)